MASRVCGLLGRRLGYSYSEKIHRLFGCDEYRLIELEPEDIAGFLRKCDIGLLNVTIPYKKMILPLLDALSPEAAAIGSVNTVVCHHGHFTGYNTDAYGFARMAQRAGIAFAGEKVLIFGGFGGAAMAAGYVARTAGAREVVAISRTGTDNYQNLDRHANARILINATPVGTYPDEGNAIADISRFPNCAGVLDLVYNPARTNLLMQARDMGIAYAGGLTMLVEQAKAAQELYREASIPDAQTDMVLRQIARDEQNIALIGMPGCGKTSVGRALGALTGRAVLDTDEEIVKSHGMTIPELFAREGVDAFRRYERETIARASLQRGIILVTGGGAVLTRENYLPLHRNARVYHIERAVACLARDGRPLSRDVDLTDMYQRRLPEYRRFRDATVANDVSPTRTAQAIWEEYCENIDY